MLDVTEINDIATATVEVDVEWSTEELEYRISYYCPESSLIRPTEGNGDKNEVYDCLIERIVYDNLFSLGIPAEAIIPNY